MSVKKLMFCHFIQFTMIIVYVCGKFVTATLDGGLGYVLPVPEKTYRRLLMLQNVLVNHVDHTGGLNPKAFR
jgi:cleavage and polyadenylation specificity factor subunit 1